MKFYYVYMLLCSDETIYIGMTNSVSRRLIEHQKGNNRHCYTYLRRPLKMIFHQEFIQFQQAKDFEKKIKKWSKAKKLALADKNFDKLQELSKCKNETNFELYKENKTKNKSFN